MPDDVEEVHGWLLRASADPTAHGATVGFTGRGNSALVLTDPDAPGSTGAGDGLADRLALVDDWYADRGLPPRLAIPLPHFADLCNRVLAAGWEFGHGGRVMVRALDGVAPRDASREVAVDYDLSEEWLGQYHHRGGSVPAVGRRMLARGERVGFASILHDGHVVAIGRGVVTHGWLGINAVEVAPAHRRRGLASDVLAGLATWARGPGVRGVFLQVDLANTTAHAMYRAAGFVDHHVYRYLRPPPDAGRWCRDRQGPGAEPAREERTM